MRNQIVAAERMGVTAVTINSDHREDWEAVEAASEIVRRKGRNEFTVQELIILLQDRGTSYAESTIRTHVVSRCCVNAPDNHLVTYEYFERIARGIYRVLGG